MVAGVLIGIYGIQAMLTFALCGLGAGIVVMLFLKETAPRVVAARVGENREQDRLGVCIV